MHYTIKHISPASLYIIIIDTVDFFFKCLYYLYDYDGHIHNSFLLIYADFEFGTIWMTDRNYLRSFLQCRKLIL